MPLPGPMWSGSECYLTLELGFQGYRLQAEEYQILFLTLRSSCLRNKEASVYKSMTKSLHPRVVRVQGDGIFMRLGKRDFQLGNSTRVLWQWRDPWYHIRGQLFMEDWLNSSQFSC